MEEKLHYYLFSFIAPNNVYARATMGWPTISVTESRINEARGGAFGWDCGACPLAVSYLGHMTPEEAKS